MFNAVIHQTTRTIYYTYNLILIELLLAQLFMSFLSSSGEHPWRGPKSSFFFARAARGPRSLAESALMIQLKGKERTVCLRNFLNNDNYEMKIDLLIESLSTLWEIKLEKIFSSLEDQRYR